MREGVDLHVRETAVELVLETRGREHAERVLAAVRAAGYAGANRSNSRSRPSGT